MSAMIVLSSHRKDILQPLKPDSLVRFTNALTISTAGNPESSTSALYHNNGDVTFTDVTEGSGLAHPG